MSRQNNAPGGRQYLSALKAAGAVLIAVGHYRHLALHSNLWLSDALPLSRLFGKIYQYSFLCVEMFFLLSGFGLASQYIYIYIVTI